MGCRESKLDVATGNTISQRKKSKADAHNDKYMAPPEARPDDRSGVLVEKAEAKNENEGETKENEGGEAVKGMGRSISRGSPSLYFSSRKDDEAVAGEESSEYSSPPHEVAVKENVFVKDAVEEMKAETQKNEKPENMEEESEKTMDVVEENLSDSEKDRAMK